MSDVGRRRPGRVGAAWVVGVLLAVAGCGGSAPEAPPSAAPGAPPPAGFEDSLTGYLSKTYDGDHDLCVAAAKAALGKLGLKITAEEGGIFKKSLDVEAADGTTAVVWLTGVTKATTRVSVKVGYLFGDRDAAQRIHSEIEGEITGRRGAASQMQKKWGGGAAVAPTGK